MCFICRDLATDPVCHNDESSMACRKCMDTWFASSSTRTCPNCAEVVKPDTLKPVSRMISTFRSKLLVMCPNAAQGCKECMTLDMVKVHTDSGCLKEKVDCTHPGCHIRVTRDSLEQHLDGCHKRVTCPIAGCNAVMAPSDLDGHMVKNLVAHMGHLGAALSAQRDEIRQLRDANKQQSEFIKQQFMMRVAVPSGKVWSMTGVAAKRAVAIESVAANNKYPLVVSPTMFQDGFAFHLEAYLNGDRPETAGNLSLYFHSHPNEATRPMTSLRVWLSVGGQVFLLDSSTIPRFKEKLEETTRGATTKGYGPAKLLSAADLQRAIVDDVLMITCTVAAII
jgi:hypothetical protein